MPSMSHVLLLTALDKRLIGLVHRHIDLYRETCCPGAINNRIILPGVGIIIIILELEISKIHINFYIYSYKGDFYVNNSRTSYIATINLEI